MKKVIKKAEPVEPVETPKFPGFGAQFNSQEMNEFRDYVNSLNERLNQANI